MVEKHIAAISTLSYDFLLGIALSKEPLTYSYVDSGEELQVEVQVKKTSEDELEVLIAVDGQKSETAILTVNTTNKWHRRV